MDKLAMVFAVSDVCNDVELLTLQSTLHDVVVVGRDYQGVARRKTLLSQDRRYLCDEAMNRGWCVVNIQDGVESLVQCPGSAHDGSVLAHPHNVLLFARRISEGVRKVLRQLAG